MRTIDADALKEYVKIFNIGCGCDDDHHERFLDAIDDAPTIEPGSYDELTISRQAAIDTILGQPLELHYPSWYAEQIKALPSAQPKDIRINLNESIKVKLTELGKEIFYHQYDAINKIIGREVCKPSFPKEDENGYTEFQLWEFIELYGLHMGITLPNVIEPLEIIYKARRVER